MAELSNSSELAEIAGAGIVRVRTRLSVAEAVERLKAVLAAKGIMLFALIDQSGEAAKAGLAMPDTKLLVFGNPKAGTPVMLARPTSALDLPLKILVREDPESSSGPAATDGVGRSALLEYNAPAYLAARHGVPPELLAVLAGVEGLVAQVVRAG